MSEKLTGKISPFTGRVGQMKASSAFLASEDLLGLGEMEVVIEGVFEHNGETMQDGKKKDFFSIGFAKTPKKMVLNATNRKTLAACFGADTTKWIGKKVSLYVQDGVRNPAGGATVCGLRPKAKPDAELLKANRATMTGGAE